jgi:hypothetical protein
VAVDEMHAGRVIAENENGASGFELNAHESRKPGVISATR